MNADLQVRAKVFELLARSVMWSTVHDSLSDIVGDKLDVSPDAPDGVRDARDTLIGETLRDAMLHIENLLYETCDRYKEMIDASP